MCGKLLPCGIIITTLDCVNIYVSKKGEARNFTSHSSTTALSHSDNECFLCLSREFASAGGIIRLSPLFQAFDIELGVELAGARGADGMSEAHAAVTVKITFHPYPVAVGIPEIFTACAYRNQAAVRRIA